MLKKCHSGLQQNNDKCLCECKKRHVSEKAYIWNPAICSCQNEKYLASIIDVLATTYDEIRDADDVKLNDDAKSNDEETKIFPTYLNDKK